MVGARLIAEGAAYLLSNGKSNASATGGATAADVLSLTLGWRSWGKFALKFW